VISFIFFFLLFTLISLFIPSHIRISKAINIYAAPKDAIQFISDTSTWKQWQPLYQQMVAQQKTKDFQIQLQVLTDSTALFQTRYASQKPILNGFQAYQFPGTDSLTLQWYMDFQLPWYPWQKFGSLFYENTYGQVMQKGLAQIKQTIEE
jgi:hypothetical protein